jgi:hypothetical protein
MGVLLLALAAALFAPRDLYACSCIGSPQPCEAVWNTRYVFTGTVTAMRREGNLRAVTFRVERTWRHDVPGVHFRQSVTVSRRGVTRSARISPATTAVERVPSRRSCATISRLVLASVCRSASSG